MIYVIFCIITFIAGVLCSGYVVAAIGGLKTDLAMAKIKIATLEASVTADIAALKAKLP